MKKEDYMKLSKERLAELLEERDNEQKTTPYYPPTTILGPAPPCYSQDGVCSNPYHDCINCPRIHGNGGGWSTSTTGTEIKPQER